MGLNLYAASSKNRAINFSINIKFLSKALPLSLSKYLNEIYTSQTLHSFGYSGLKLNIPVMYFMTSGCLVTLG